MGEGCEDWNADKIGKSIPIFEDGILLNISYHSWRPRDWSRVLSVDKRKHFLIHSKRKEKLVSYSTSQVMFIKAVLPKLDVHKPSVSPQMVPQASTFISQVSLFSYFFLIQFLYLLS